ncbi:MAG: ankyrin repeat domain-containing protein [Caldilineaceae bacterium]
MAIEQLRSAVKGLASATAHLSDAELASGAFAWGDYTGVRMALLGTAQDLDALSAALLVQRAKTGNPITHIQHLLGHHRVAYRDLEGLLAGIEPDKLTRAPAQGEWPVVEALHHLYEAERSFFISILAGIDAQAKHETAVMPPRDQRGALLPEAGPLPAETDGPAAVLTAYTRLHFLIETKLAGLTHGQLEARSPFWEPEQPSVAFRVGRFTAHLREHRIQIEKTLLALGHIPHEMALHTRMLYQALGRVEGALMGAPELAGECESLARAITERSEQAVEAVADSAGLMAAIRAGNTGEVDRLLAKNPLLMDATDANQQSAVLVAAYAHQTALAQKLHKAGAELDIFSAAAIGYLPEVEEYYAWNPATIDWFAKDGFTPLQLACYFGQEEVALWLIAKGADIHAVSKNGSALQAIHAGVAGRNATIVRALLEAGADKQAEQAGGFTPLMAAEQNGDKAISALLRRGDG